MAISATAPSAIFFFSRCLGLLSLAFVCAACVGAKPASQDSPFAPNITGVSRVVIPSNGGQTIHMPRLMGDATTMWRPLDDRERRIAPGRLRMESAIARQESGHWLPSTEHDTMNRYLYRLTHERRRLAEQVLARAEMHMPIVLEGVRSRGLPPEIACLPLVESAFEPRAVSPAGAAGLWQLMPDTARRYGLVVSDSVDERFDVYKSTQAATTYLASLYDRFRDWPLAIAAYNCGEGAMQRAMNQTNCNDLDSLTAYCRQAGRPLVDETLSFVPQFMAAVIIMTKTDSFGLASRPVLTESSGELGLLASAASSSTRSSPSASLTASPVASSTTVAASSAASSASADDTSSSQASSSSGRPVPRSRQIGPADVPKRGGKKDGLNLSGTYEQTERPASDAPPPSRRIQ